MAAQQPPLDTMDMMAEARYAPLVFAQPLNALPGGDYQKYLPRFNVKGETTTRQPLRNIGIHFSVMQITKTLKQQMYG